MDAKIHAFEQAGLGRAPFRFVGIESAADRAAEQRYRESAGLTYTTNHCTSCDYCGQAIQNAYRIESADHRLFKVGCDCVRKTGDAGLMRHVAEQETRKRRAASRQRQEQKIAREQELLDVFRSGRCEVLRQQPHPKGRVGATAYDYVEWCVENRMFGATAQRLVASC